MRRKTTGDLQKSSRFIKAKIKNIYDSSSKSSFFQNILTVELYLPLDVKFSLRFMYYFYCTFFLMTKKKNPLVHCENILFTSAVFTNKFNNFVLYIIPISIL